MGPAAASLVASCLLSRAATWFGSNLGAGGAGGLRGGIGVLVSAVLLSGFFACSFAKASAIGSGFCSAFALSGRCSTGFASGAGGGSRAALTSFFSTIFAVTSSAGFTSSIFSATGGFGVSALGASLLPDIILVKSDTVTRSTGKASGGGAGSGLAASDQTLHSNTAACPIPDMV